MTPGSPGRALKRARGSIVEFVTPTDDLIPGDCDVPPEAA